VTGPRLAILAMLEEVGGHRSADELVLALRRAGYHHARTTVYNALDDLARAKLVRAAPVDAGALRFESDGSAHYHFVCRRCGLIRNVGVAEDLATRPLPPIDEATADELDVVYRGLCASCQAAGPADGFAASLGSAGDDRSDMGLRPLHDSDPDDSNPDRRGSEQGSDHPLGSHPALVTSERGVPL